MRFIVLLLLTCASVKAATWTAAGVALADVQAAVNQAAPGDTVMIPAGSAMWTTGITLTRGITIQGNGVGSTVLMSSSTQFFTISPDSTPP